MLRVWVVVCLIAYSSFAAQAEEKTITIYQDADLWHHIESSEAIQRGIRVAFDEIGGEVAGYHVKFKFLDHRGNVVRSKQNYQTFIDDPNALAIYSGIHSPPLIKNRNFINENKALTLVPWAAGGPITRYPSKENWIFRLSIDDMQAGPVIVDFAMKNKQCKAPHLLLEDTPWGGSNLKSMSAALSSYNIEKPLVTRFGWSASVKAARLILSEIAETNADCILFVGNAVEGKVFAQAMLERKAEKRLPIISHWGITGGNFHEVMDAEKRKGLDLHFIQSCFAFSNAEQNDFAKQVFKRLQKVSEGQIKTSVDLKSAVGFIHAYDLTRLFISAIKQVGLTGDMAIDRDAIRMALEDLQAPVQGLIKDYSKPFSVFDAKANPNAHEALHKEYYCMGRYAENNEIVIVE